MDDCPRQDPAYRPAKGKPRSRGAFLFPDNRAPRHGPLQEVQRRSLLEPLGAGARVSAQWLVGIASHRLGDVPRGPDRSGTALRLIWRWGITRSPTTQRRHRSWWSP